MASFPYYLLCDKLCVFYFWINDLIGKHSYFFNVDYIFNDMNGLLEQKPTRQACVKLSHKICQYPTNESEIFKTAVTIMKASFWMTF